VLTRAGRPSLDTEETHPSSPFLSGINRRLLIVTGDCFRASPWCSIVSMMLHKTDAVLFLSNRADAAEPTIERSDFKRAPRTKPRNRGHELVMQW